MRRIAGLGRGLHNLPKHALIGRPIHRRGERLHPALVQREAGRRDGDTARRRRRSPPSFIARAAARIQKWENRKAGEQEKSSAHEEPRFEGGASYASTGKSCSMRDSNARFESLTAASQKGMPGSFRKSAANDFLRRLSSGHASWAQHRSQRQSEQRVCGPLPFLLELIFPIWSVLWRELRRAARRVPAGSFSPHIFPRSDAGRY